MGFKNAAAYIAKYQQKSASSWPLVVMTKTNFALELIAFFGAGVAIGGTLALLVLA